MNGLPIEDIDMYNKPVKVPVILKYPEVRVTLLLKFTLLKLITAGNFFTPALVSFILIKKRKGKKKRCSTTETDSLCQP